ncbi:cytochrome P450 [Lojkania enalia]|uniref:Cytochrome P450 n=1 Tax=Lojkania enalia TaxID=147567 RepID=A0A9P4K178_9PLEO|nr:cytochrome P450 [Didymosphaeria enalia]
MHCDRNKYGDGTPFFINAAGNKILVILDPDHVKKVLQSSIELDPNPFIHQQIMGQLMGSPRETVAFYNSDGGKMDYVQTTHIRQHLTGSSLVSMDKRFFTIFKRNIATKYAQNDSEWMEIPDLYDFMEKHVTLAIAETLLGSAVVEEYAELVSDLWLFIENTDNFFIGLPRFIIPSAYAARDRLLCHLKKWSRESERLRDQDIVNRDWDPIAGSGLLQEREKLYSEMPGHGEDGRASQTLGLLYGGTSLTVPVTFWYLFETLRDRNLHHRISTEIRNHVAKSGAYDFTQLAVRPILQSLHAETTRYRSSNLAVRIVTTPRFVLDEKYTIERGTTVFIFAKYSGQFTPGWASARPKTVSLPLEEFWPERFLVSEKRERFSDSGLGGCWTSFGGGEHKCPGRHFARNIGIVVLSVLMGEFECELVDIKSAKNIDPPLRGSAFGTMRPTRQAGARLRKRRP